MVIMIKYIIIAVGALFTLLCMDGRPSEPAVSSVEVRAAPSRDPFGRRIPIGVRFKMADGWHTYAENPGDSGLPPDIRVKGPEGMHVEKWKFPPPTTFRDTAGTTYGYERDVVLFGAVTLPVPFRKKQVLTFEIDWMVCNEVCVPLDAVVTLQVEPQPGSVTDWKNWESFLASGGWSACSGQEEGVNAPGKETTCEE